MKVFPIYIFIFLFLLVVTASCSHKEQEKLALEKNARQILFFSDEKQYEQEAAYYDALIELKKEFPDEMENLMVLSSSAEKHFYKEFDIESGPALIVIYNDKVVVKINGDASKEQIIKPIANAFTSVSINTN